MRRICTISALILLWLVLCMLFLTGCHAHAPVSILTDMGSALGGAAEYTLFECLYLFVSTDYGEFCAIVACCMATHLVFVVQRYALPLLERHAPRLARAIRECLCRLLRALRERMSRSKAPPEEPTDTPTDEKKP